MQILNIIFILLLLISISIFLAKISFDEQVINRIGSIAFRLIPLLIVIFSFVYLIISAIFLFLKKEENDFIKAAYWINLSWGFVISIWYLFPNFFEYLLKNFETDSSLSSFTIMILLFVGYSFFSFISFILFLIGFFKSHKNI